MSAHLRNVKVICSYALYALSVIMKVKHILYESPALQDLHSKIVKLFKPWIFPLDTDDGR